MSLLLDRFATQIGGPSRWLPLAALLLCLATVPAAAQDADAKTPAKAPADPKFDSDQISYFLGVSFGQQLAGSGFRDDDLSEKRLMEGLRDGMDGKEPDLTEEELRQTQTAIQQLLGARMQQLAAKTLKDGQEFLKAREAEDGVKKLDGGVLYKVIKAGEGDSPTATDTVEVHYEGRLIGGQVFDSSIQREQPAKFRLNQVIKGWQIALQEMKVGSKWQIYIPSDLAYGPGGKQPLINPNSVLTFVVELIDIQ